LEASVNPFDTPEGACLPADLFPLPSYKRVIYSKGTLATGASGFGYIALQPSAANDFNGINYTTAPSIGGATTTFSAYTGLQGAAFTNGPYADLDITSGQVAFRSVAYGIRVRCTASAMSRGGSYVCCESQNHDGLVSTQNFNSLKSLQQSRTYGIPFLVDPDQWDASVCDSGPVLPQELQFVNSAGSLVPNVLIIAISSAAAGMTFDWEVYHHVEYIGRITQKTPSHADAVGFGAAVEAMKGHTVSEGPVTENSGPSIFERFKEIIREKGPRLFQMGTGVAKMLMGDEAGGMLSIADGGFNILADSFNPQPVKGFGALTELQKSVLAPNSKMVRHSH
jgi:hypothetical protein